MKNKDGHVKACERYVPWTDNVFLSYEHLHRYRFAKEFVKNKKVLDLACGEGYGCLILAEDADEVIGVDIKKDIVEHASSKYTRKNIKFLQGSITDIPIDGVKIFDIVVSFEAIEHITEQDKLMREVKRLIKDDGILIMSTPNKYIISDVLKSKNPFHLKELYFEEFRTLLDNNFRNTIFYGQKICPASIILPFFSRVTNTSNYFIDKGRNGFRFVPPEGESKNAFFFIAVSSNNNLNCDKYIGNSCLADISKDLLLEVELFRLKTIERSLSWRTIKSFITFFDRKLFPPHTKRGRLYMQLYNAIRSKESDTIKKTEIKKNNSKTKKPMHR
jgi:2-polyprenyl-3-methyl-5-hydroxy-6-metoxy-1,4-benzoquinol methylase